MRKEKPIDSYLQKEPAVPLSLIQARVPAKLRQEVEKILERENKSLATPITMKDLITAFLQKYVDEHK